MNTSLIDSIHGTFSQFGVSPGDDAVLVGVSGGADSVSLLAAMHALRYRCVAGHVEHNLRGEEGLEDARFVERVAQQLGVAFAIGHVDVLAEAEHSSKSIEMIARRLRYDSLAAMAREHSAVAIATAHHADDQAETVLLRVLRGASPKGLAGIPVRGEWGGVPIIRPLLHVDRASILAYLKEHGLEFRDDSSNVDVSYLRNRVRQELLPQLESQYNPSLRSALCRLADSHAIENDFLQRAVDRFASECAVDEETLHRREFSEGHPALQRRFAAQWLKGLGAEVNYALVDATLRFIQSGETGAELVVNGSIKLVNGRQETRAMKIGVTSETDARVILNIGQPVRAFARVFELRERRDQLGVPAARYCTAFRQIFDASKIQGEICARRPRDGDRFRPLGMSGHKKLGDYFTDVGVPRWERPSRIVIADDSEILWIVGGPMSEAAAIRETTERILEIEVSDAAE